VDCRILCFNKFRLQKRLATVLLAALIPALARPGPASAVFQQDSGPDGIIAVEAEQCSSITDRAGHTWKVSNDRRGFSGDGFMAASPDDNANLDMGEGPSLDFQINFVKTGMHYLWVRGYGIGDGDTCHAALDGRGFARKIEFPRGRWTWVNESDDDDTAEFRITEPGVHTVSILMREDGACVDRILITTNPDYRPERFGPAGLFRGGEMTFESTGSSGIETDAEIIIPVTVTTYERNTYSVNYSIAGGTADSGDYQFKPGTLTFQPGEKTKIIRLRIVKDDIDEEDETVILKLSNANGPDARVGMINKYTYTIIDPRPVVEFESAVSGVSEQDDSVDVTVRLTAAYEKPVTVDCLVGDGSATEGVDYTVEGGSLRFAPGELRKNVKVSVLADDVQEHTETIELKLGNAVNAKLNGRTTHSVNICEPSYAGLKGAYYYRYNSGQQWEEFAKVGPHPDVMVRLGDAGDKLVFWRGSSYLPFFESKGRKWFVDEVLPRKGDGQGLMYDRINQYSHVRIVENSPARAIVHWRYIPDFENPTLDGWAEEYFTIYPDGVCFRAVRKGTETLEDWENPANTVVLKMLFTDKGVIPLPKAWGRPVVLSLGSTSAGSYHDLGYDRVKGCYIFKCSKNGAPGKLEFKLAVTANNPVVVVQGWGDADVKIAIDDKAFREYSKGCAPQMNGNDLVLWFDKKLSANTKVAVEPIGGSGPIARAPIPDAYSYRIPVLPEGSSDPGPFGAYYTHLKYFKEWDEPWRAGEYADIVVQFDQSSDRFIFWRGTSNVPHWVNDENHWYDNEFCERRAGDAGLPSGCAEPMQDHECRYSHARVIHSHDARVIVHWRYAPTDGNYDHVFVDQTGWGDWVDEYYTVYPDEVCLRKATLYTSAPDRFNEWHEAIPLVNPGCIPEDVIHMDAVAMTDINRNSRVYSWKNGFPKDWQDGLNIMLVRLKGKTMPFAIVESRGVWVDEVSMPERHRFNHYDDWPGWPARQRRRKWDRDPNTGYREFWRILPSHSSLMHFEWDYYAKTDGPIKSLTRIMLNGMTAKDDVTALIPLARSWENPPRATILSVGYTGGSYDKTERAYRISRRSADAKSLEVTLQGSADSPILNPCFVIENWPEEVKAGLTINGQGIEPGSDFRQGIETDWGDWDTKHSLIVWARCSSTETIKFTIQQVK